MRQPKLRRRLYSTLVVSLLVLVTGCSSRPSPQEDAGSTVDAGAEGDSDGGACVDGGATDDCCACTNDFHERRVCVSGSWVCPSGTNPVSDCPATSYCRAGLPPPPSTLRVCADSDAGVCLGGCDPGEVCYTQVSCGPLEDGGFSCGVYTGGGPSGDDRCHRECQPESRNCGGSEVCVNRSFFNCTDFSGYTAAGRPICCNSPDC